MAWWWRSCRWRPLSWNLLWKVIDVVDVLLTIGFCEKIRFIDKESEDRWDERMGVEILVRRCPLYFGLRSLYVLEKRIPSYLWSYLWSLTVHKSLWGLTLMFCIFLVVVLFYVVSLWLFCFLFVGSFIQNWIYIVVLQLQNQTHQTTSFRALKCNSWIWEKRKPSPNGKDLNRGYHPTWLARLIRLIAKDALTHGSKTHQPRFVL